MRLLFIAALMACSSYAAETVVPKAKFVEAIKTGIPKAFCGEKAYFRKCFKVTEDQCLKEAARDTKTCLTSIDSEIPKELHQPADGKAWGTKIGTCAGTNYETTLAKSKISNADCNNPSKWQ